MQSLTGYRPILRTDELRCWTIGPLFPVGKGYLLHPLVCKTDRFPRKAGRLSPIPAMKLIVLSFDGEGSDVARPRPEIRYEPAGSLLRLLVPVTPEAAPSSLEVGLFARAADC